MARCQTPKNFVRLKAAALVATLFVELALARPRPIKAWRDVDWDAVDKQFEHGDDPDILRSEDEVELRLMERRKDAPLEPPPGVELSMPGEEFQHAQAAAGPTMLFVTLKPTQRSGAKWDKAAFNELANEWREVMHTAGVELTVYELDERRVLVTLHSGWRGWDVKDYLLRENADIVEELEWDKIVYKPSPSPPVRPAAAARPGGKRRKAEASKVSVMGQGKHPRKDSVAAATNNVAPTDGVSEGPAAAGAIDRDQVAASRPQRGSKTLKTRRKAQAVKASVAPNEGSAEVPLRADQQAAAVVKAEL